MTARRLALAALLTLTGCAGLAGGPVVNSTTSAVRLAVPPEAARDSVAAVAARWPGVAVRRSGGGLHLRDTRPGQDNRADVAFAPAPDGTTRVVVTSRYRMRDGFGDLPGRVLMGLSGRDVVRAVEPALPAPGCQGEGEPAADGAAEPEADPEVRVVQTPPELVGGLEGLAAEVRYPESARRRGVEGVALVQFVVDETGAVACTEVLVSPDPEMSAEAVRALGTRSFRPGTQRGVPVKVRFTLPLAFRLQ